MERKQGFLGRIVDIGAELFAISAACVKAAADGDRAVELADAFAAQARVRVDELFDRLWRNADDSDAGAGPARAGRPVHLAGGRGARPVQPRAVDRGLDAPGVHGAERAPQDAVAELCTGQVFAGAAPAPCTVGRGLRPPHSPSDSPSNNGRTHTLQEEVPVTLCHYWRVRTYDF